MRGTRPLWMTSSGSAIAAALKLHCRCSSRRLTRLEVRVVGMEASKVRPDAVRELSDERVVVAQGFVVTPPRHLNAVLCSLKLILQRKEVLVRLEIRIGLGQRQQPAQRSIQLPVRLHLVLRRLRVQQAR